MEVMGFEDDGIRPDGKILQHARMLLKLRAEFLKADRTGIVGVCIFKQDGGEFVEAFFRKLDGTLFHRRLQHRLQLIFVNRAAS